MNRQRTKTDAIRREHYLSKMIEKTENAMREYQRERGGEHCLYVAEYIRRRSYLLER